MPLPQRIRSLVPDRLRDSPLLRSLALRAGAIPPRTMHTDAEAALLSELAEGRRRVVEVGVYEGSSALVLLAALPDEAELHLIDPFGGTGPRRGWRADPRATMRTVERVRRPGGPEVHWHVAGSARVARGWSGPVDLVFVDGDHAEAACALDWELWSPHVEPGGAVAFHDARQGAPGGWGLPGPTAVVRRLLDGGGPRGWRLAAERDTLVVLERLDPAPARGKARVA